MAEDTTTLVRRLVDRVGETITAVVGGVRDRKTPSRWADGTEAVPEAVLEKLTVLDEIFSRIAVHEGEDIACAWLIGSNPNLNDQPIVALREGRLHDTQVAANRFIDDVYS